MSAGVIRYPVKNTVRFSWSRLGLEGLLVFMSWGRRDELWELIMRCTSAVSLIGSRVVVMSATWMTSAVMALRTEGVEYVRRYLLTFSKNSRKPLTLATVIGSTLPSDHGDSLFRSVLIYLYVVRFLVRVYQVFE